MHPWQQTCVPLNNLWLSSPIFTGMVGIITTLQACVLTWRIP